ncbi:hypothetical protein FR483_n782L [Paramecium bursaria Chlorella virus FR483]|uniref:Uncharacterized protein n782L n=1 Tax=Paramecium bursaria Chlorella virus FR483 TaxID=399781 RepID=A7J8D6_PBCVF|nr:hypothetical protein FR483_n782L [Paramecium bursaria Chlorella virus FR483]ABT16067.1 hypothetical protein FR483_n782L [Paramecium bursaria Chlorella virus FR483]
MYLRPRSLITSSWSSPALALLTNSSDTFAHSALTFGLATGLDGFVLGTSGTSGTPGTSGMPGTDGGVGFLFGLGSISFTSAPRKVLLKS